MVLSKSLEHSVFQWDINNFKFCLVDQNYFFVSPVFDLVHSSSNWYLELHISHVGNMRVHLSIRLCRAVTDEGPEEIKVRFSLTLLSTDGTIFWAANNHLCTFRKANTCGIDFETDLELVTFLLRSNDTLIVNCQLFATADLTGKCSFDFKQPDLDVLSQDLSQLIFRSNIPRNATLLAEGDDIPVHKEILCARSPVFVDLFAEGVNKIEVPYSKEAVLAMLVFLYSGDIGMMAASSPPPIELCHLAHHYRIPHLQNILIPQKVEACTTIETSDCSYRWNIPNFTVSCFNAKALNTGVWEFENVQIKISLIYDTENKQQGNLEFFVQLWNLMEVISFSIDMSILDIFGNRRVSQSTLRSPTKTGIDNVSFYVEEQHMFGREHVIIPHDALCVHFYFNFRLLRHGELSSLPVHTSPKSVSNETFASHSLSYQLKDLLQAHLFADVNIRVCDVDIPVHKSILSARSSVFRDIFRKSQTYKAADLSLSVVQQLLYYIYTGYIYTDDTKLLIELYDAADTFSVPQLKDTCYKLLSECRITASNVCSLFRFSDRLNVQKLRTRCVDDICKNADIVLDKPSWASLKSENPKLCTEILDMILSKTHQHANT